MARKARPRIALAYVRQDSPADARYVEAIEAAGGTPVPLWADDARWEQHFAEVGGLLLTGGGDIAPQLYGGDAGNSRGVDLRRDEREVVTFALARGRRLPILGICRGLQLINVAFDACGRPGALLADLPEDGVAHRTRADKTSAYHPVDVLPGTRLAAEIGGAGRHVVNSRHHQGLRAEHLAAGLVVSALAADGVVEGLEAPGDAFLLAVQCHPERSGEVPAFAALFRALVLAAERRRGS